ncbi:MAG: (2Fe-2S) ferredoxin domain-containing protein [Bacteroidota bacterium]
MKTIRSLDDLNHLREEIIARKAREAGLGRVRVTVGLGSCGIAAGALAVLRTLEQQIAAHKLKEVTVTPTGCVGLCRYEPIVEVSIGEREKITYGRVSAQAAERIVLEHLIKGKVLEDLVIDTTPFPTI